MASSAEGGLSDVDAPGSSLHQQQAQQAAAAQAAAEEEAQRISLLDVIIEEYNQEKNSRTSRMLLIGEVDSEKIPLLQKFHADFLDSLDMKELRMTGALFVVNGSVMIQMVEAPTKVLVQLMRNLAAVSGWSSQMSMAASAASGAPLGPGKGTAEVASADASSFITVDARYQPLLRSSAILSFTEEVPREFHIWAFRSIRLPADDFAASAGQHLARDALKLCFETLRSMLELGRELQGMSEEKAIDFVQTSVSRQLTTKLPSSERLLAFITSLGTDLCTVPEWLDIYDTPIEFTLENEKVWPVEPFLKY